MAQNTVRLGFVGAGAFSRRRLIPNFKKVPGVDLAAVSNRTEESSRSAADEHGFHQAFADWQQLVASPNVDAVVVGTQEPLHALVASAALEAGKHVLVMNALATSLDDARQVAQKAKERPGQVVMLFPSGVYQPQDALMRELLKSGYIGDVQHALVFWNRAVYSLGTYYEVGRRWLGRHTRLFAHRRRLDVELTGPRGALLRPTYDVVLCTLDSGATVQYLHAPAVLPGQIERVEIYGSEGTLVYYEEGHQMEGVYGGRASDYSVRKLDAPPHTRGDWHAPHEIPVEADFIAAIREGKKPSPSIPSFDDGVDVLRMASAWRQSIDTAGWVDIPRS